jgi:hypothetical protein
VTAPSAGINFAKKAPIHAAKPDCKNWHGKNPCF